MNAKKRQKRLHDNLCSPAIFDQCKPVKQLLELAEHVKAQNIVEAEFIWVKGIITDVHEPAANSSLIIHKCIQSNCKGKIVNNKCNKCGTTGPGKLQYLLKLQVMCYDDSNDKACVVVVNKGGKNLFGMSPEEFHELTPTARAEKINKVTFKPVAINASVTYDAAWNVTSIFPFDFKIMDKTQARASPAYAEYLRTMTLD